MIDQLLLAILPKGDCLLFGVPGRARTLVISALAETRSLSFNRIQLPSELMPSDITGTEVIREARAGGTRQFKFIKGSVFANVILADEINRTPPKTQAVPLEAVQAHRATAVGEKHVLPELFLVLATENPIEQEGIYSLPEAQLERFIFNIFIDCSKEAEELDILKLTTATYQVELAEVLTGEGIHAPQEIVRRVPVAVHVIQHALKLTRMTRAPKDEAPDYIIRPRRAIMSRGGEIGS